MISIEELRAQPHISASGINNYTDCGMLYRLSRIDKRKPSHINDSMIFGSVIHKAIADMNIERMNTGNIVSADVLTDVFEMYWYEAAHDNAFIKYDKGRTFDSLLLEGKAVLQAFHESIRDNYKVLSVEEPFVFHSEGVDIPIIGLTDIVEEDESGTIIIADYKTASKSWSSDQVDKNFQITVYQMAAKANGYADREILLRIDCLIKTKKPKFEQYYTVRTDEDERRASAKIRQVWEGITKGIFILNDTGWKCHNCAYKIYCNEILER